MPSCNATMQRCVGLFLISGNAHDSQGRGGRCHPSNMRWLSESQWDHDHLPVPAFVIWRLVASLPSLQGGKRGGGNSLTVVIVSPKGNIVSALRRREW